MIVKTDAVFFITFKHDYRDDIQKHSTNILLLVPETKLYLLVEINLSNSKSKAFLKAAHSIEEIIQPNIRSCKKFDLSITEFDKSLAIMYWLHKIHKTLVGVRFIVASYYCSTNPLSDTISKMIVNTVQSFQKNVYFIPAVRNSGLCKILFLLSP